MRKHLFSIAVLVILIFIGVAVLFALYVNTKTSKTAIYNLGDNTLEVPIDLKSSLKDLVPVMYVRNGYCGFDNTGPKISTNCKYVIVGDTKEFFVFSFPNQYGYLFGDTLGCYKEDVQTIKFNGKTIVLKAYYQNLSQTKYDAAKIDLGKNPYDCSSVETTPTNFHHLDGCDEDICIWAMGSKSYDYLKSVSSQIKFSKK